MSLTATGGLTQAEAYQLAPLYLKAAGFPQTPSNVDVMAAWLQKENGGMRNRLGFTNGSGQFYTFNSEDQNLAMFASFMQFNHYRNVRAAFQSGGDGQQVVDALKASPWSSDRYAGTGPSSLQGLYNANAGTSTTTATTNSTTLAEYLGVSPATPVTQEMVKEAATRYAADAKANESLWDYLGGGSMPAGDVGSYLVDFVGHPAGSVPFYGLQTPGRETTTMQGGVPSAGPQDMFPNIAAALAWFATHLVPMGAMLFGGAIIIVGVIMLAKGSGNEGGGGETTIQPTMPILIKEGA